MNADHAQTMLERILDRPIAYHRVFANFGGVAVAVLLSQAIYWQPRVPADRKEKWWWKTTDDWYAETGLTRREFETARARLTKQKILKYRVMGVPARGHYMVDWAALWHALTSQASLAESANQDCANPPTKSGRSRTTISEITPETTSETMQQGRRSGPAADAAAGQKKMSRKRRRIHRDAGGLVTWTDDEADEPGALVDRHGLQAVAAAVQAVEAAGRDPVPGLVAVELKRRAAADAAAAARATKAEAEAAAAVRRQAQEAAAAQRQNDPEVRARIAAAIDETARTLGLPARVLAT